MNIKRASLLLGLAVIAVAYAQNTPPLAATWGRGVVVGANNRSGEFNFEVVKRLPVDATEPVVRGRFEFATVNPNTNQRVRIVMDHPVGLGVNGHVAEFGGPGFMMRPSPSGPQRVNGRIAVRVEDLWTPPTTGNPGDNHPRDKFAVRFFVPSNSSTTGEQVFELVGELRRGDLVVRSAPTTGN